MRNIILVVTDTFRFDNLYRRAARPIDTPNLNRFAQSKAALAERMYTGSFPTIPHRTDLATGRLGWPSYGWQPIDLSSENHIAKILGAQGYATQLICDCPHLFNARFNPGFDAAFQNRGQEGDRPLLHLNDEIIPVVPENKTRRVPTFRGHSLADTHRWTNRYPTCETDTFPAKTGTLAIRWLEENYESGPFFLWVDLFDPHEPWDAPEYLIKKYDPNYDGTPMIHPNYGPSSEYSEKELNNLWAHYAAEAELVDKWIGRILEKISDLRLWDDSVVVVTTDHGISIGEHDRTGKSNIHPEDSRFWPIFPEIGRIPLLIAAPEIPAGSTVSSFVQPIDILPTVADFAGATLEHAPEAIDGFSRADEFKGEAPARTREYAVSGCNVRSSPDSKGKIPEGATMPFVVLGSWGYAPVGPTGKRELYNIEADPLAQVNVAKDYPERVNELHDALIEHIKSHRGSDEWMELFGASGTGSGVWATDYSS